MHTLLVGFPEVMQVAQAEPELGRTAGEVCRVHCVVFVHVERPAFVGNGRARSFLGGEADALPERRKVRDVEIVVEVRVCSRNPYTRVLSRTNSPHGVASVQSTKVIP